MRWILALVGLLGLGIGIDYWIQRAPIRLKVWVTSPSEATVQVDCFSGFPTSPPEFSLSGLASGGQPAEFTLPEGISFQRIPLLNEVGAIEIEVLEFRVMLATERWDLVNGNRAGNMIDEHPWHKAPGESGFVKSDRTIPQIESCLFFIRSELRRESRAILGWVVFLASLVIGFFAVRSLRRIQRVGVDIPATVGSEVRSQFSEFGRSQSERAGRIHIGVGILMLAHVLYLLIRLGFEPIVVLPPPLIALGFWCLQRRISARSLRGRAAKRSESTGRSVARQSGAVVMLLYVVDFLLIILLSLSFAFWVLLMSILHMYYWNPG